MSKVPSQSSEPFAEVREDGHAGGSWQPHKFPGASKTWFEDGKIMHCLCYVVTQRIYIYNYVHINCFLGMTKANTLKTKLHISTYVVFGSVIEVVNSEKDDKQM